VEKKRKETDLNKITWLRNRIFVRKHEKDIEGSERIYTKRKLKVFRMIFLNKILFDKTRWEFIFSFFYWYLL